MGTLVNRRRYMGGKPQQFTGLRLVAVEDTTFTFTFQSSVSASVFNYIEYSINGGATWNKIQNGSGVVSGTTPVVEAGNALYVRGDGITLKSNNNNAFISSSGVFDAEGDIMSILGRTAFVTGNINYVNALKSLFYGTNIRHANALVLSSKILYNGCYIQMFYNCSNLIDSPIIESTSSAGSCCQAMFRGCTNLVSPPILPATTLSDSCYYLMFQNCKSLETAPVLPALSVGNRSYREMFSGCSSLNYVKAAATTFGSDSLTAWMRGVSKTGTFVKNVDSTWSTGEGGIPSGWTVISEDFS